MIYKIIWYLIWIILTSISLFLLILDINYLIVSYSFLEILHYIIRRYTLYLFLLGIINIVILYEKVK